MNRKSLILLPLLFIYIFIIVIFDKPLGGDELRYVAYAQNLSEGFYTDSQNPDLSNGPGYPLVLLPFVALNIDLLVPRILNGFFVFIGIFLFYKTLQHYTKQKYAMIITLLLGLYPPLIKWMSLLYSEAFSFMLLSGFIFYFCYAYFKKQKNWKTGIMASFFLGFLILTKVVFFHVLILSIFLVLFILIFSKNRSHHSWTLYMLIGAFIFTTPFVLYAYSVTGKLFYLGTRGGEILYHRSTPFEGEYGNWVSPDDILFKGNDKRYQADLESSNFSANHRDFYLQLEGLSNIQKDSAFKSKALQNMNNYPLKYSKNTLANMGRLFFNYPNSHRPQSLNAYGYILPNGIILMLLLLLVYPSLLFVKKIPFEIKAIFLFAMIYGFGMLLLSGKPRYFTMMVPSLILMITYVSTNVLKWPILENKKEL